MGLCGRNDAIHIVTRERNIFRVEFDGGTLCTSLSGPDVSILFGKQVARFIESPDCDELKINRFVRLQLIDSMDEK